jgi:hypothetical protein
VGVQDVVAVEVGDPVALIDRLQVALTHVRRQRHRGQVLPVVRGQPLRRAGDDRAGRAAEQQPAPRRAVPGSDRVGLLDVDHLVDERLVELRGRTAIPSSGSIRRGGAPPKLTDPAASTATIRTYGRCSLNQRACDRVLSPGFYDLTLIKLLILASESRVDLRYR